MDYVLFQYFDSIQQKTYYFTHMLLQDPIGTANTSVQGNI